MEHHDTFFGNPRTWVGIAFTIFFLIFGNKIWTAITGILDKRGNQVRAELDEAARLRREAEAMLADATKQREQARIDAETMLTNARAEAARVGETAQADAVQAAKRRERMAMDRIAAAEKAAVTDVRLAAADVATRAAASILSRHFGAEQDSKLIDDAITGLPAALSGRRAA